MYCNKILKYLFLFHFGGSLYTTIELFYRNRTYIQMYVLAGIVFILCDLLNEILTWEMDFSVQVFIGSIIAVTLEFITGLIFNIGLGMEMWNYYDLPFNLFGQISLQYYLLWIPLVAIAIILADIIRWKFFDEERPYYRIGKKYFII